MTDQLSIWGDAPGGEAPTGVPDLADGDVRRRIVEEVHRSSLVEASAGTGKTKLLVDRVLQLVRTGVRLENMVAITFTEKAAGELRARIRDGIQKACRDEALLSLESERFAEAVGSLDRATISTIHSFCTMLLKSRPVEAGVSPGFQTAAKVEAGLLRDEAWELWKERELERRDSPIARVIEIGGSLRNLRILADVLVENRDLLENAGGRKLLEGPLPEWRDEFEAYRRTLAPAVFDDIAGLMDDCRKKTDDKLWTFLAGRLGGARRFASRICADDPRADLLAFRPWLFSGKKRNTGSQENWKKESLVRAKQILNDMEDACDRYISARRARATVEAIRALSGYLSIYERLKAERGYLDFQDLLIRTRDLVRDHPDVRADFQGAITHLMVDEFQDTDPLQAEIVFLLAGADGGTPGDWEAVRVEPGRLFLVGDPKQSIYRFRRADIQVYQKARKILEASGGDVHPITVNFRTRPGIADWVNRVFERLMPADTAGTFRPAYSRLDAFRNDGAFDGPAVERIDRPPASTNPNAPPEKEAQRRRTEARAVADLVRTRIENRAWTVSRRAAHPGSEETTGKAGYGDVAVLFRALTGLEMYEDAFREASVPYRIEGGKFYFRRREVQAMLAVLRAINSPNDREALVAALRSPLFGFDDDDLVIAASEHRLTYGFHSRPSNPALAEVYGWLSNWHERRHVVGPEKIVAEVLEKTQALTFFAMQHLGEQRVANLLKIMDEARRYGGEPGAYRAFIDHLSAREAALESEEESQVLEEDEGGSVHFITVHKAKGLEFPVVVIADLLGGIKESIDAMLFDRPTGRLAFRLQALGDDSGKSPDWEALEPLDREQQEAEERRLFYVAATRARDHLVLPLPETAPEERACFYNLLKAADWPPAAANWECPTMTEEMFPDRRTVTPADLCESEASRGLDQLRRDFRDRRAALLSGLPAAPLTLTPSGFEQAIETTAPGTGPDRFLPVTSFRDSSKALSLGRLVHEVLQRVDLDGEDALARVDMALPHHPPLGPPDRDQILRLVRSGLDHPVWVRARNATNVWREAPFFLKHADEVYVDGAVDLLIEEPHGLTVVDFKTDRVGRETVDALFARYRGQALGYALGVTRSTGRPVREVVFLFLDNGESRSLAVDDSLLAEAERLFSERAAGNSLVESSD